MFKIVLGVTEEIVQRKVEPHLAGGDDHASVECLQKKEILTVFWTSPAIVVNAYENGLFYVLSVPNGNCFEQNEIDVLYEKAVQDAREAHPEIEIVNPEACTQAWKEREGKCIGPFETAQDAFEAIRSSLEMHQGSVLYKEKGEVLNMRPQYRGNPDNPEKVYLEDIRPQHELPYRLSNFKSNKESQVRCLTSSMVPESYI